MKRFAWRAFFQRLSDRILSTLDMFKVASSFLTFHWGKSSILTLSMEIVQLGRQCMELDFPPSCVFLLRLGLFFCSNVYVSFSFSPPSPFSPLSSSSSSISRFLFFSPWRFHLLFFSRRVSPSSMMTYRREHTVEQMSIEEKKKEKRRKMETLFLCKQGQSYLQLYRHAQRQAGRQTTRLAQSVLLNTSINDKNQPNSTR